MNYHIANNLEDLDEMTDLRLPASSAQTGVQRRKGKTLVKQKGSQQIERTVNLFDEASYPFSYHASRHEKQWLLESISEFHEQKWIEDILMMVRGGKEATVYLCSAPERAAQPLLAAKIYRPRRFRNLKKDHLYREGRDQLDATGKVILDHRAQHAMQKRTAIGLELLHASWIGHEFHTMQLLSQAGVDLPAPYVSSDNAILMEYIGDETTAAPTLNTVSLSRTEAKELFQRVAHNIELMLSCNRVHADLSAYNILYWEGAIKLIDFPQAIHPDENHNSYRIFQRDVRRVCEYFESQGVKTNWYDLARKLWTGRGSAISPELDPAYLDPENNEDLALWKKQNRK